MDIEVWKARLENLPLGEIHLYHELGSTNQLAEELIHQGVPHLSLVLADSQTAGKGRSGRSWITKPGVALAFSLILVPERTFLDVGQIERLSGLGSLAVAETLSEKLGLDTEIKWPNDVLVERKKVSGVLVDIYWTGPDLNAVLGIGVNIHQGSVPEMELNTPAACVGDFLEEPIDRLELLVDILQNLLDWFSRIQSENFLRTWEHYLAYKGEKVILAMGDELIDQGIVLGLSKEGALVIRSDAGEDRGYRTGEIHLRLIDRS
jgi:BirA family biotin operon repressor/biotin-[acetyl-CoA-carboxylase] ligase